MRVASYNILDGGTGRADPIAEVLLAQRADVVALVEADDPAVVARVARRLGLDYVIAEGRHHAAALLSRWPIVESANVAALRRDRPEAERGPRCLLRATVETPGGPIGVGVVHCSAHSSDAAETAREAEVAVLLDAFADDRAAGRPHLLLGDFNSNAPVAAVDPQKLKPRSRREFDENGGFLPRRAIGRLLDAGYVDCLHAVAPDDAATAASFTTLHPGQRVDYVFARGLAPADAWVERDRLARYASDHYPVGAAF